ncbi:hypothetical protein J9303_18245 [Bacillaceae bacterium Marseille-Q3522]|nr:hypothetical protein [Bacillaceae bacterium Marseille-Q3522]
MNVISLQEIADKLDEVTDTWYVYYHVKTEKFVDVQIEYISIAEEMEEDDDLSKYMDWEQEEIKGALNILENWNEYIRLPTQFDIHEYSIMEDYAYSVDDARKSNKLLRALSGRGAFRRFKDTVIDLGLSQDWYDFRDLAYL